jgi:hypothetical protein
MKTLAILLLTGLIALSLGCGYSHSMTPAMAGSTPVIKGFNPASVAHGGPAFTLEVDGTSFNGNATVTFAGAPMTLATAPTATKIMVTIPDTAIMNAGSAAVVVTNPGTAGGIYGGGTNPAPSQPMDFTID